MGRSNVFEAAQKTRSMCSFRFKKLSYSLCFKSDKTYRCLFFKLNYICNCLISLEEFITLRVPPLEIHISKLIQYPQQKRKESSSVET